jgi:peptidyl-prolyl cis-trans isomerase SurA
VRGLAGLAVASAVLLTGCGAVPDLNPGVAVRVGDDSVSARDVADLASDYCDAAAPQLQGKALPRHYLNGRVASSLALRSAADQLLAAHGVAVDKSYAAAVAQAETQLGDLTTAQRDAIIEVQGTEIYVAAAETSVGRATLGGSPSDEDAKAAGEKEFLAWLDDHDVRIDPRYGVAIEKGQPALTDTSLSVGVSKTAKQADAATPDSTYAGGLPSTQRCG